MTDTTHVQQLRKTISGEFYFGAMCRETKRRIAISTDTSRGKQSYSQSAETIVSCNHCHKTHRFDNRDIFSFPQVDRKSTRLNSSHPSISYAVFCLKTKTATARPARQPRAPRCRVCARFPRW